VSDPNGWGWATEGCRYAAKTINAWAGDEPKKGRHPWLINCAVRLAALHRWGCLTEELHERAVEVLHDRVRRLCEEGIGGPVRAVAAGELADALAWGRAKAASKADEALTSELGASGGCHKPHPDQLPADAHPAGGASEGWRGSQATGEPTEEELTQARRDVLTHADQAAVIARDVLGDRWLWSKTLGWQQWDGKRWADRTEESVVKVVSGWLRRMVHREAEWADNTRRNQLYALLRGSSIEPIVRLCRAEVEVHDVAAIFDAHPDLLNCANGVLDLRTGELGPHDPKLHMRKIAPVEYHPEAVGRPELAAVLDCVPDPAVREWLQLIFGQALTGHPQPDPVVPILQGGGRNGKSTLITAIRNAFGPDYGVLVDDRVLLSGADSAHSTERMDLLGTRFALVEELPGGRELNTTKIKKITGTDAIKARRMHRDPVEFRATHALVLTTNFTPVIREVDEGSWRRIAAVPFPVRYRPEGTDLVQPFDRREDQKVYTAVRAQDSQVIESVLAWLVEGARRWYADGRIMPKRPAAVEALTQSWRGANDVLGEFIAESLEADRSRFVLGTELYAHYEEWCRQGGHPTRPVNQIKPELLAHPLVDGWGLHDDRATPTEMVNLSRPARLGNVRLPTTRQRVIRGLRFRSEARPATGNDDVPTQEVIHLDARRK
jgi:putative DNA primase/helicase